MEVLSPGPLSRAATVASGQTVKVQCKCTLFACFFNILDNNLFGYVPIIHLAPRGLLFAGRL